MQLTSTSEEDRSLRHSPPSLWSRLNRPLVPGIIAFLGWLGFALARWQIWAQGHLSLFIMAGHTYTHRSQLPPGLLLVPSAGYDGQFYYRLALDPANWHAHRVRHHDGPVLPVHPHRVPDPGLDLLARPAPARARRAGRAQPLRGGGHGHARRHVRPRRRPARPVGARLRRVLRPGHQRGPGYRRTGGRGVHAGWPARLPAGRHPDVPAGHRAVHVRRDHQGNHLVRPGRDRRHPADRDGQAPRPPGPGRPDLARPGRRRTG